MYADCSCWELGLVINGLKAWGNYPLPMWGSCEVVLLESMHWFSARVRCLIGSLPSAMSVSCQCTKQRMRLTLLLSLKLGDWVQLGETMSAISHLHSYIFSFRTNSRWNSGCTRPQEWPRRWVHCSRPCLGRVCSNVLFSLLEEGGIARCVWAEDVQPYLYWYSSTVELTLVE